MMESRLSNNNYYYRQWAISEFQKPSLLKRGQVQNLSYENEFYLHDNKKSFAQERFCTWPRFKTEACGISEMAYFFYSCIIFLNKQPRYQTDCVPVLMLRNKIIFKITITLNRISKLPVSM